MSVLHLEYQAGPLEHLLEEWDRAIAGEPPLESIRWHLALRRSLRNATVSASTGIEGNPLSPAEVGDVLTGGTSVGSHVDRQEVENYNAALHLATAEATDREFAWSPGFIRRVNLTIMRALPTDTLGRYRDGPVTVAGLYLAPSHLVVPRLVNDLAAWLEESAEHPLVRIALLHLNVVAIHPFDDGNGRTARVLSSAGLVRAGVSSPELITVEPYLRAHRDEYFERLATTIGPTYDPENHPATPWVEYYVRVSVDQLRAGQRLLSALPNDIGELSLALERSGAPSDWGPILLLARIHPVRTVELARLMGLSPQAVRATLSALVKAGWLDREGRTRGSRYHASPRLRQVPLRVPVLLADLERGRRPRQLELWGSSGGDATAGAAARTFAAAAAVQVRRTD